MKLLSTLLRWMVTATEWALVAFFSLMVGAVFLQVVGRHVFQAPPFWTEEVARYLLVWMSFIGAALAHYHREHITVEVFPSYLPPKWKNLLDICISVSALVLMLILVRYGISMARSGGSQMAPATGLSMYYVYAALPTGAALMAVLTLTHLWEQVRAIIRPSDGHVA